MVRPYRIRAVDFLFLQKTSLFGNSGPFTMKIPNAAHRYSEAWQSREYAGYRGKKMLHLLV
jgi:hypothetical protein